MFIWLERVKDTGIVFTDAIIRAKAREFGDLLGLGEDKFKASSGWVENFKARQGIKKGKYLGVGTHDEKARALGYGLLETADEPTFIPPQDVRPGESEQSAWPPPPPPEPEYEQPEPGPVAIPDPVPVMVPSADGLTQQEIYVVPRVNVVKEPLKAETLEDAEAMVEALREFAQKNDDIITSEQGEVLREILVNIVRHNRD
ncbi:hypothetical protein DAEQUDRAFT_569951 [Daedalea quercina L-15889]|uniref:HTH CENPB-type domain-containing protein n=1 Tax=Daedalea quercina L-15889 TaxID=1314783 RepID=A0A165LWE7_9APHY|nr:hypothetical protein DAEQUDRAFT_569951 [Daedalea quercina L-15889]